MQKNLLKMMAKKKKPFILTDPYVSRFKGMHDPADYSTIKEDSAKSSVFLIRHAYSAANEALGNAVANPKTTNGDFLEVCYDKSMIDCGLTKEGINQCEIASEHAAKINFKEVWVSPLRRTLETAYFIFRNHPNFKDM